MVVGQGWYQQTQLYCFFGLERLKRKFKILRKYKIQNNNKLIVKKFFFHKLKIN